MTELPAETEARNRLGDETSPYLLQHRDNPVHWMAWGAEAFERARRENKPVLLSVGYAACHWCHVMAHESFESEEIAALMNRLFVNVKVDREERPDVDAIYQSALALLGEQGGWPLTMFLTPDGEPFWGGTYFPSEDKYGRPGFPRVLERISEIYRQEQETVTKNVDALRSALREISSGQPGGSLPAALVERLADAALKLVDATHGGAQGAPKFPQCALFDLFWRAWKRSGDERFRDATLLTLDRMSQGGIYDHLGGGYARYSTDAVWLAPHFEKMLYDNAQILDLLALAWAETGRRLFAERARETVDWLEREMLMEGGAFAGTLDADSEGEEGRFYVWTAEEIDALLGPDAIAFKAAYDVKPGGNWEGKTILNRSNPQPPLDPDQEAKLARARQKLLAARAERVRPALDDKIMADWNGLMIAALARAGIVFEEPRWIALAEGAFRFVVEHMTIDGRLRHSWRAGRATHPATLDDHAALIAAALALHGVTGRRGYLDQAERWAEMVERRYRDPAGGYYLSADDVDDVILRTKSAFDNATPSGNGMMVHNLARLFLLTGDEAHAERAEATVAAFSGQIDRQALAMPVLLTGNALLQDGLQVVVAGDGPQAEALVTAALRSPDPAVVVSRVGAADTLPDGHPAAGKGPADGRPAAYLCKGRTCSLPLGDPDRLAEEIARQGKAA